MSYILEALRKSEQERNPTEVPNLKTHHPMIHKESKSKTIYWIFGIALLLINGLVLAYLFSGNQNNNKAVAIPKPNTEISVPENLTPKSAVETDTKNTTSNEPQIKLVQDNVVEVLPIINPPVKEVIAYTSIQEGIQETKQDPSPKSVLSELDRASVPDIFDLDYAFQQKIPNMEFSTHIFVSNGGSFVIINGKSLSDGMPIDRGLFLVQILSDGIILRYRGRRFFLESMTSWQQN